MKVFTLVYLTITVVALVPILALAFVTVIVCIDTLSSILANLAQGQSPFAGHIDTALRSDGASFTREARRTDTLKLLTNLVNTSSAILTWFTLTSIENTVQSIFTVCSIETNWATTTEAVMTLRAGSAI